MPPKLENRELGGQLPHPALRLIAARPELFARQGAVRRDWRRRGRRKFGPYYRLAYREAGRRVEIYLGRSAPLAAAVRAALVAARASHDRQRDYRAARRALCDMLRKHKAHLDGGLRALGLRLKGFEIRGWQKGPARQLRERGK